MVRPTDPLVTNGGDYVFDTNMTTAAELSLVCSKGTRPYASKWEDRIRSSPSDLTGQSLLQLQ